MPARNEKKMKSETKNLFSRMGLPVIGALALGSMTEPAYSNPPIMPAIGPAAASAVKTHATSEATYENRVTSACKGDEVCKSKALSKVSSEAQSIVKLMSPMIRDAAKIYDVDATVLATAIAADLSVDHVPRSEIKRNPDFNSLSEVIEGARLSGPEIDNSMIDAVETAAARIESRPHTSSYNRSSKFYPKQIYSLASVMATEKEKLADEGKKPPFKASQYLKSLTSPFFVGPEAATAVDLFTEKNRDAVSKVIKAPDITRVKIPAPNAGMLRARSFKSGASFVLQNGPGGCYGAETFPTVQSRRMSADSSKFVLLPETSLKCGDKTWLMVRDESNRAGWVESKSLEESTQPVDIPKDSCKPVPQGCVADMEGWQKGHLKQFMSKGADPTTLLFGTMQKPQPAGPKPTPTSTPATFSSGVPYGMMGQDPDDYDQDEPSRWNTKIPGPTESMTKAVAALDAYRNLSAGDIAQVAKAVKDFKKKVAATLKLSPWGQGVNPYKTAMPQLTSFAQHCKQPGDCWMNKAAFLDALKNVSIVAPKPKKPMSSYGSISGGGYGMMSNQDGSTPIPTLPDIYGSQAEIEAEKVSKKQALLDLNEIAKRELTTPFETCKASIGKDMPKAAMVVSKIEGSMRQALFEAAQELREKNDFNTRLTFQDFFTEAGKRFAPLFEACVSFANDEARPARRQSQGKEPCSVEVYELNRMIAKVSEMKQTALLALYPKAEDRDSYLAATLTHLQPDHDNEFNYSDIRHLAPDLRGLGCEASMLMSDPSKIDAGDSGVFDPEAPRNEVMIPAVTLECALNTNGANP
jgi:hypothetical protein